MLCHFQSFNHSDNDDWTIFLLLGWDMSFWFFFSPPRQYHDYLPTAMLLFSAGLGCCLSACQMCVNPSRPPGRLTQAMSWWVLGLVCFLFFALITFVCWHQQHVKDMSSFFYSIRVNVVCCTLCLPRDFEWENIRQVHQRVCVCVFIVLSVVAWFTFGPFPVWQHIINCEMILEVVCLKLKTSAVHFCH